MNTIRLSKGEILFEEFDDTSLNEKWVLIPNDVSRYSLTERSGFLKLFHGYPDLYLLTDELDNYIMDVRNEYIPFNSQVQAGVVVFSELGNNLEVLEWYDETRTAYYVYQYIRVIKQGNLYTIYGRNTDVDRWEIIATLPYQSSGKVGLVVHGQSDPAALPLVVDYVRFYKSHQIQILNVPLDYRVDLCREGTGEVINSKKVVNPYNGAVLITNDIPPFRAYFRLYDENNTGVHTSSVFDMVGGDIYYYGSTLGVSVDGNDMYQDSEYFLGYFQNSVINFTVELKNTHDVPFQDVILSALQYMDDIGYSFVKFSLLDEGPFVSELRIGSIPPNSVMTVYGKVIRDVDVDPSDVKPYKFNLKLTNA